MSSSKPNRDLEQQARLLLNEMIDNGDKVSPYALAKRLGTSNANLYKNYPKLVGDIKIVKERQRLALKEKEDDQLIARQKSRIDTLESKLDISEVTSSKELSYVMMAAFMETYRAYDDLLKTNQSLKSIIEHRTSERIDAETGEVIIGTWPEN